MTFEKYKPRGLFSQFYRIILFNMSSRKIGCFLLLFSLLSPVSPKYFSFFWLKHCHSAVACRIIVIPLVTSILHSWNMSEVGRKVEYAELTELKC